MVNEYHCWVCNDPKCGQVMKVGKAVCGPVKCTCGMVMKVDRSPLVRLADEHNTSDEPAPVQQAGGGVRSATKPYYSAIPPRSLERVALRATGAPRGETRYADGFSYQGGSDGYGYGNWARGLEFEDTLNHIYDHLKHWRESIEAGMVPEDDDLSAIAWGVLMPLMTFEQRYASAYRMRLALLTQGRSAEDIDNELGSTAVGRLIKPLSPKKVAPKPDELTKGQKYRMVGLSPKPTVIKEGPGTVAAETLAQINSQYADEFTRAAAVPSHTHNYRWYNMNADVYRCGDCGDVATGAHVRNICLMQQMDVLRPR